MTGNGVTGDGTTDDTAAIQALIDTSPSGSVLYFPAVSQYYRITDEINITQPLTLIGDGQLSNSQIKQTSSTAATVIFVRSSDVTIRGLRIVGYEYGAYKVTNGISVNWRVNGGLPPGGGSPTEWLDNINILDNWLQDYGREAINTQWVTDFIITGNHIERSTYGGIAVISSRRGLIAGNHVENIGNPPGGGALVNSYPIANTTWTETDPKSEDLIFRDNYARNAPIWSCYINHGGDRVLFVDNDAYDCDFLYANTSTGVAVSHDTSFINNYGENGPRQAQWLVGPSTPITNNPRAIGNTYKDSDATVIQNSNDAVYTWNTHDSLLGTQAVIFGGVSNDNVQIDHNDLDGGSVSGTYTTGPTLPTPPTPTNLTVTAEGSGVRLSWSYTESTDHDSFYIEREVSPDTWERVAFRPPHDGMWDFGAPANPSWVPFDPLEYIDETGSVSQRHRIRANNGTVFSGWATSP